LSPAVWERRLRGSCQQRIFGFKAAFVPIPGTSFDSAFLRHEIGDYRYFVQHFEAASRTSGLLVRQYATSEIANLREDQPKIAALAAGAI
jgi:hypothetical protein